MILSNGAELTWQQFIQQPEYEKMTLSEQTIAYDKYLSHLANIRNSMINHQNKGRLKPVDFRDGYPRGCNEGIDVVFLIDYTGSMGTVIDDVKTNVVTIMNTIIAESSGNYRLGLVLFDEYSITQGNPPQTTPTNYGTKSEYTSLPASQRFINLNTTANKQQWITAMEVMSETNQVSFTAQLDKLNDTVNFPIGNGASAAEPGDIGYEQVLNGFAGSFREDVSRLVILITDAAPSGYDDTFLLDDITFLNELAARSLDLRIQPLILSSRQDSNELEYKVLSNGANGSYTFDNLTNTPAAIIKAIQDICVINNNDADSSSN
jgi:hypothetical protein